METVRVQLANIHRAAYKKHPMFDRPSSGVKIKINAANPKKEACSGAFGTPDWTLTSDLSLRRRSLYTTELRGHIQKLFNFPAQQETNELPLRRRTLYPGELRGHIYGYILIDLS